MHLAAILALIQVGGEVAKHAVQIAGLLRNDGVLSAEQLETVRREAGLSDAAWDAYVDEVRSKSPLDS